jgi:DNA polymerase-3 subunit alpha
LEQLDVQPDYFEKFSKTNPQTIPLIGLKHINLKKASDKIREALEAKVETVEISSEEIKENIATLEETAFAHLHNHSQFSILQSTSSTKDLVEAAVANNMPAIALTDSGNMMGAFHFTRAVNDYNKSLATIEVAEGETPPRKLKAIVGCEFFLCL